MKARETFTAGDLAFNADMDAIPEDVMKAARHFTAELADAYEARSDDEWDGETADQLFTEATAPIIARAIMAERQRCIRVLCMWALANEEADTSLLQGAIDELRKGEA